LFTGGSSIGLGGADSGQVGQSLLAESGPNLLAESGGVGSLPKVAPGSGARDSPQVKQSGPKCGIGSKCGLIPSNGGAYVRRTIVVLIKINSTIVVRTTIRKVSPKVILGCDLNR
jgi:hypothetical protein